MLEQTSESIRFFHGCERRDCDVDISRKTETWECHQIGCEFAEEVP
jgi:hypothetical protein